MRLKLLFLGIMGCTAFAGSEIRISLSAYSKDSVIAATTTRADLIVVGTLDTGNPFPWVDGWHYRPSLRVREVLRGNAVGSSISLPPFRMPFGVSELLCNETLHLDVQAGIWFLQRQGKGWKFVDTDTVCGNPVLAPDLAAVREIIRLTEAIR